MRRPTEQELRRTYAERAARLAARENEAWMEYLAYIRAGEANGYESVEPFAWRRLRRALAELAHDRRRYEFELERALVDARGISRAS
jgi:hypothetical protein